MRILNAVNTAEDTYKAISGKSITGEKLSPWEHVLAGAGAILGIIGIGHDIKGFGKPPSGARPPLKDLAIRAGVREEIEEGPLEVFAHGTTADVAKQLVETQGKSLSASGGNFGGKFFTVPSAEVAEVFAARSATQVTGGKPAVVGVALPKAVADRLRAGPKPTLVRRPIENPPPGVSPDTPQWVFHPDALKTLKGEGFFFHIQ